MSIGAIGQAGSGVFAMSERPPVPPSSEEMFNKVDSDGSGGVDKVELSDMAQKMSRMHGETVDSEALMASFDADEDGTLSESELDSALQSLRPSGGPQGAGPAGGPPPGGPPPGGASGAEEEDEETELEKLLAELASSTESSSTAYLSMSMAGLVNSSLDLEA